MAPGVHLVSDTDTSSYLYTNLANNRQTVNGHPMLDLTGTSMAAPITAGVVALVLDANGALTPNAVKAIVEYTRHQAAGADYLTQGAGEVNAGGAVALAGAIDTRARMNSWWLAQRRARLHDDWRRAESVVRDHHLGQRGSRRPDDLLQQHHLGHNIVWGTHNSSWRQEHHLGHEHRLGHPRDREERRHRLGHVG